MFWFHCGHCGSLFQAVAGHPEARLCAKCGSNPCPTTASSPMSGSNAETTEGSPGPGKKKHRNQHLMLKLLSGCLLLVAILVFGSHLARHGKTPKKPIPAATADTLSISMEQDIYLLHEAMPQCLAALSGFIASNTPAERSQFVFSPISTAYKIDRYYTLNPAIKLDPSALRLVHQAVLHLPGAKAIETHWKSKHGKDIDAVFREENGEWRLDWEQFIRYSDYPWLLFLAGTGPPEAEFRLLARERLAEERKNSESISLVLYAPRFGNPLDAGIPSPEFLIPRNTRDAQLLDAAFRLTRSGKRVFDSQLPDLNPGEMIPVRVKVRRINTDSARHFEITSVTACHWYSSDDPGVERPAPEAASPVEIK